MDAGQYFLFFILFFFGSRFLFAVLINFVEPSKGYSLKTDNTLDIVIHLLALISAILAVIFV